MRLAVDPACHPAHHDEAGRGELAGERARNRAPVRGARARSDDGDRRPTREQRRHPPAPRRRAAAADRGSPRADAETPHRDDDAADGSRSCRRKLAGHAVRERLGDMRRLDDVCARKHGDRASDARNSRASPTRERQPVDCARQQLGGGLRSARYGDPQPLARFENASAHVGRRLSRRSCKLGCPRPWHRDREIEPIEKRARELLPICRQPLRRATALDGRIAASAARAHVHRADEHEASREERVPPDARDRHHAVLQGLPQRLENGTRELGQLVQEQHAAMRERDLARPRARILHRRSPAPTRRDAARETAAPDTSARPGGRRPATEWIRVTSSASARVSAGRIPGKRRASIVLPVPGGPISKTLCEPAAAISSARRARSCPRTSARSGCKRARRASSRQRLVRRGVDLSSEVRDDLGEIADGHGLDARERSLGRRLGRADDPRETSTPRPFGDGERPRHRANPPVERRAHRRPRARRAARAEAAWSHRARPARSEGRIPILPCAMRPGRD